MDHGGLYLFLLLVIYFIPSIIALSREHHQSGAISALNILLGWTVLGWIVCAVWSVSEVKKPPAPKQSTLYVLSPFP